MNRYSNYYNVGVDQKQAIVILKEIACWLFFSASVVSSHNRCHICKKGLKAIEVVVYWWCMQQGVKTLQ